MSIKSVKKALAVLRLIAHERDGLTAQEISKRLALPYATAYRILSTLCEEGYVDFKESHKTYRVGPEFLQLYGPVTQQANLGRLVYPLLATLSRETEETVHLAVRYGREVMYLETIPSARSFGMYTPVGTRGPLHSTALGKALLSFLPDAEIKMLLAQHKFVPRTPYTITDKEGMWAAVKATQQRGYALDWDEGSVGLRCVSAAIINRSGYPEAAISVSVPSSRLETEADIPAIASKVVKTCHAASEMLGGRLGPDPERWYDEASILRRNSSPDE